MIQNTDNKPLSELFSADNKITYHIPKYQREYVWGKWNWESLFDDIDENEGGHFLGSIICINVQKDSHKPADLELVDGQQRMTTISLLYLALYKFLKEHSPKNLDEHQIQELQVNLILLKKKIVQDGKIRLSPSYSNNNYEDYNWIFSEEIKEVKSLSKPKFLGLRQIARAYNYFLNRLNETDDNGDVVFTFEKAEDFLNKL